MRESGLEPVPGDWWEDGLLQVVTVQSSTDTDFRSEGSDRSIFNGQHSYIVSMNVLCFTQIIQQGLLLK